MTKAFLLAFVLVALSACGDICKHKAGTWTCTFTATSAVGCDGTPGPFTYDYVLAESDDRECTTEFVNEGPTYVAGDDYYMWTTGSMSGVESDRVEGNVTYRYSYYVTGEDPCTVSGPIVCTPK